MRKLHICIRLFGHKDFVSGLKTLVPTKVVIIVGIVAGTIISVATRGCKRFVDFVKFMKIIF